MTTILIVGQEDTNLRSLALYLRSQGHQVSFKQEPEEIFSLLDVSNSQVVLVDMAAGALEDQELRELLRRCSRGEGMATLALVADEGMESYDLSLGFDEVMVRPYRPRELAARMRLALWRRGKTDAQDVIRCSDLLIDLARYEVHLAGKVVDLTYKEYELLRFLASNQDKVFSREALLSRVWGYDYYGGTRTVDVHIRRLRSKIEDVDHVFIETVRNVGYRFRAGS